MLLPICSFFHSFIQQIFIEYLLCNDRRQAVDPAVNRTDTTTSLLQKLPLVRKANIKQVISVMGEYFREIKTTLGFRVSSPKEMTLKLKFKR